MMNRIALTIFITSIWFSISTLQAEPSPYEFKVASTEFAAFAFDKSSEAIVKKWAQKHRPKLYALAFSEKKKAEDEGKKGFVAGAMALGARNDVYLDYYLNRQAEDGWEPFKLEEKTILLRRKRS